MALKPYEQKQFDILAKAMDAREEPFRLIKEFEDKHGFVPLLDCTQDARFMASYRDYKLIGGWRNEPAVVRTVEATAKMMAAQERRGK